MLEQSYRGCAFLVSNTVPSFAPAVTIISDSGSSSLPNNGPYELAKACLSLGRPLGWLCMEAMGLFSHHTSITDKICYHTHLY
jgi:hypothetical protein